MNIGAGRHRTTLPHSISISYTLAYHASCVGQRMSAPCCALHPRTQFVLGATTFFSCSYFHSIGYYVQRHLARKRTAPMANAKGDCVRGSRPIWLRQVRRGVFPPAQPRRSGEQLSHHTSHRGSQAGGAVPPVRTDAVIQRGEQGERQRDALRLHLSPKSGAPPRRPLGGYAPSGGAGDNTTLSVIMYYTNTTQGGCSTTQSALPA